MGISSTAGSAANARCDECNGRISVPVELEAVTMRCTYCGHQQPVPDLAARRAALVERERLAVERERLAREAEREAQARRERDLERKESRRGRRWTWVVTLLSMLIAPVIISITVFDLPARLGFGSSGAGRLEQIQAQLTSTGCSVLEPIDSEYTDGNVSRLVKVDKQCIRVLAAGGGGHHTLALKLFAADGKQIGEAGDTIDPQLAHCSKTSEMLRYEIVVSPASKGRLSHLVLACPTK